MAGDETISIPCVLNAAARRSAGLVELVGTDSRFDLRECTPERVGELLRQAIAEGARRIVVVGGDGTIATAAGLLAGTEIELGVVPGGTLNHFARTHGIPLDPKMALEVAATGSPIPVDVGYVNEVAFLNTSTVGAYIAFVRVRERWKPRLGYWLASAWAALRIFRNLPLYSVTIETEQEKAVYHTPMVFVGVGERELKFPAIGERASGGRSGLHTLVVEGAARARILAVMLAASAKGVRYAATTPHLESYIGEGLTVDLSQPTVAIAVDGEMRYERTPLVYRLQRDTLRVVVPTERNAAL